MINTDTPITILELVNIERYLQGLLPTQTVKRAEIPRIQDDYFLTYDRRKDAYMGNWGTIAMRLTFFFVLAPPISDIERLRRTVKEWRVKKNVTRNKFE